MILYDTLQNWLTLHELTKDKLEVLVDQLKNTNNTIHEDFNKDDLLTFSYIDSFFDEYIYAFGEPINKVEICNSELTKLFLNSPIIFSNTNNDEESEASIVNANYVFGFSAFDDDGDFRTIFFRKFDLTKKDFTLKKPPTITFIFKRVSYFKNIHLLYPLLDKKTVLRFYYALQSFVFYFQYFENPFKGGVRLQEAYRTNLFDSTLHYELSLDDLEKYQSRIISLMGFNCYTLLEEIRANYGYCYDSTDDSDDNSVNKIAQTILWMNQTNNPDYLKTGLFTDVDLNFKVIIDPINRTFSNVRGRTLPHK